MTKDQELVEKIAAKLYGCRFYGEGEYSEAMIYAKEFVSLCRQHFRTATLDEVKADVQKVHKYNGYNYGLIIKAIDNLRGERDE